MARPRVGLLLDTHVWIWSLAQPERLSPAVRRALTAMGTGLWLSPISLWETLLLGERGRLALAPDPHRWIEAALMTAPVRDAPLTREIARRSRSIDAPTDDPADRFIAATAQVLELTLVTSDARLLRGRGYSTMANR